MQPSEAEIREAYYKIGMVSSQSVIEIAHWALGKQLQQEVTPYDIYDGEMVIDCPSCKNTLMQFSYGEFPKWCFECGQALKMDWSVE